MVLEVEATHAQIQRILQSKAFRTSEVHRSLLVYLAEKSLAGTADGLKEYTVGLDVFSKPASFDPRQESAVRMHVGRLRQKLAEYYRTEGAGEIAREIGGAEINRRGRSEPAGRDQRRDQRRVAEAGKPDTDQVSAERRDRGTQRRHPWP